MHGIFGVLKLNKSQPASEYELRRMGSALNDDSEIFCEKNLGLGVATQRKSRNGQTDAISLNEDETVVTAFTGEIYNGEALRIRLAQKHALEPEDSGLIPHLYEEFGNTFGKHINGHFSFALWDASRESLLLMRDRFGAAGPVYYTINQESLFFSSQLRRILRIDGIKREIDLSSLRTYFKHSFIPSPKTIFKEIKKIPTGTSIEIKRGKLSVRNYWGFQFSERVRDEEYAAKNFLKLMRESVRKRVTGDGKTGAFLSGGVDSGLNVALASELLDDPIHTYSIGFEDSEFSELPYAALVAEHFGTLHHEYVINSKSMNCLPLLAEELEEPFADSGIITMHYAQKLAKKNSHIVLTGDGSDQLFGYFAKYVKWRRKFEKIPGWGAIRVVLRHAFDPQRFYIVNYHTKFKLLFCDPLECFFFRPRFMERELYSKKYYPLIRDTPLEQTYKEFKTFTEAYNYFTERYDIKHFLNECVLLGSGITAGINSITNRHTYLDMDVVEFITSLKADLKTKGQIRKYLIKIAATKLLPKETIHKYKQGRAAPFHEFLMNSEIRDKVFQTLYEMKSSKFFDKSYVRKLEKRLRDYTKIIDREHSPNKLLNIIKRSYRTYSAPEQVYNLYMFELWYRAYSVD